MNNANDKLVNQLMRISALVSGGLIALAGILAFSILNYVNNNHNTTEINKLKGSLFSKIESPEDQMHAYRVIQRTAAITGDAYASIEVDKQGTIISMNAKAKEYFDKVAGIGDSIHDTIVPKSMTKEHRYSFSWIIHLLQKLISMFFSH